MIQETETPPSNNKGSPKFAIPQRVADIALRYGKTVSKGIQEMEHIINGEVKESE